MPIPNEIIDNSEDNKLFSFLNWALKDYPKTNLDIATAFFDIKAYALVKNNLNGVTQFRLLLGKPPEIKSERTLGDVLSEEIRQNLEDLELSKRCNDTVKQLIDFLKKENVEVKLFEDFLHGKAYIFDNLIVIGSSNFTGAGLTRYGELNTWKQESQAIYTKKEWFEKFWAESIDFKNDLIELLDSSRYGSKEYTPYQVYIKALYELQKNDIREEQEEIDPYLPASKVNLTEFQEDAIYRIESRIEKYGFIIIADSVGLGKTWIAKKIIEKRGYYRRENILVICPAQLKSMWSKELKSIDVKDNILSQEELASEEYLKKIKNVIKDNLSTIRLVVIDESHNFRNPLSNKWEHLFNLLSEHITKKGKKPEILMLTATPINNSIWDLYWQIMLLTLQNQRTFSKDNIDNLFKFFKEVEKEGEPTLLSDLLNEISVRRTRDYIVKNYPEAFVTINNEEKRIIFPKRELENINYSLEETYAGLYREISEIITDKLSMAYYRLLDYKKDEELTKEEEFLRGRMIAIEGIFSTILLKRLESSIEAFRISIGKHVNFLNTFKEYLFEGKLVTKEFFSKYLMNLDEELEDEEIIQSLEDFNLEKYNTDKLIEDIDSDIKLLNIILDKVKTIKPKNDAKLNSLKEILFDLSKKGQVVIFTYYADTLNYIYKEINSDPQFSKIKIQAISSSGLTSKNPNERVRILEDFASHKVDILMSTDVLSEGQNLQSAQFLINYDLHWNPTRMIQRAGRIDRIGSPFSKIHVYNFFPEKELEALLRLLEYLQKKILDIDHSVGLDQTVLGEQIHPKVFGIMRRIKNKDNTVIDEIESDAFGGGEQFYQPLKDYLKSKAKEEIESIPNGVYSGLKTKKLAGIFFYYKYDNDFHFWYLYDFKNNRLIKNKTEILNYIKCPPDEKRVVPDFFEKVYEVNQVIVEDIRKVYENLSSSQEQDSQLKELASSKSTKFIRDIRNEIDRYIDEFMDTYQEGNELVEKLEQINAKLVKIPYTKQRTREIRRLWSTYKKNNNFDLLIKGLGEFLKDKSIFERVSISPYNEDKLKLIVVDLVS
ncbi:MAG: DEAD/DEAH box helicase family protein [Candidatus Methanofastidiosum sp.]|nr:DEAD/DEAH box helicase family protein [Methanofastidiosum sp.]